MSDWSWRKSSDKVDWIVEDEDKNNIAFVDTKEHARLIAAAPELLEALKIVYAQADLREVANVVLAAIAKAEGK